LLEYESWTPEDTRQFLSEKGFSAKALEATLDARMFGRTLPTYTIEDLKSIGFPDGEARLLFIMFSNGEVKKSSLKEKWKGKGKGKQSEEEEVTFENLNDNQKQYLQTTWDVNFPIHQYPNGEGIKADSKYLTMKQEMLEEIKRWKSNSSFNLGDYLRGKLKNQKSW